MPLVLMAGGMGRRFGGDKQVEPVGPHGEPLGAYTAYDALRVGFDEVVLVARPGAEVEVARTFRDALGERAPLRVVPQTLEGGLPSGDGPNRVRPWGTAHAALAAAQHIDGAFGIANADDSYGRDALQALRTSIDGAAPGVVVLIEYRAADVLSAEGGVSRGWIRRAPDGGVDVTEVHELRASGEVGDGTTETDLPSGTTEAGLLHGITEAGEAVRLPADASVSMNLWGLTAEAVVALRDGWRRFLRELPDAGALRLDAEYGLSTALTALAREGRVTLRPEPGGTRWFGMTFAADHPRVAARITALHADGTYPVSLAVGNRPPPRPLSEFDQ
ncbi:MAG: NTP transferase domain-containing protein [Gemmatimonadetes bacterium]|nr:NTP transferase domain-containing protein [Gemmatimonadota bacterium]